MQIDTTWGAIHVSLSAGKVTGCTLPCLAAPPESAFRIQTRKRDNVTRYIAALFAGTPAPLPELVAPDGTDFQRAVWRAIGTIPAGETCSYSELARTVGRPRAFRAVANACGRNPLPLFIPCHRVVATSGLGGFSSGLPWKRLLISLECGDLPSPLSARRLKSAYSKR